MNVREEDRQKNTCSSRGLGLAAAAIGVGVGAALYYIFSKRPENPDSEGSTTGWNTEQPHTLDVPLHDGNDSYITISEHSTTDTSIQDSSDGSNTMSDSEFESDGTDESNDFSEFRFSHRFMEVSDQETSESDIDTEWDVTDSSTDMPEIRPPMRLFFSGFRSPIPIRRQRNVEQDRVTVIRDQALTEEEKMLRDQAFRERTWSLEECSICFDVILKDQKVTTLPCTHHFHSDCIGPWLQEQQTCPNCRKAAE